MLFEIKKIVNKRRMFVCLVVIVLIVLTTYYVVFQENGETEKKVQNIQKAYEYISENEEAIVEYKKNGDNQSARILEVENEIYHFAISNRIFIGTEGYQSSAIYEIIQLKEIAEGLVDEDEYSDEERKSAEIIASDIMTTIEKKDYSLYLIRHIEAIKLLKNYSAAEKDILVELSELQKRGNPNGIISQNFEKIISFIGTARNSVKEKINYASSKKYGEKLSELESDELFTRAELLAYKIRAGYNKAVHNNVYTDNEWILQMLYSVNTIILIFMIVLSTSMFAGEQSNGTLKLMLISPLSRGQIYFRKLQTLIIIMFLLSLFGVIIVIGSFAILQGFDNICPYVYLQNGTIRELNFGVYLFLYELLVMVSSLMSIAFSILLSVVFKSSMKAATFEIIIHFGGQMLYNYVYNKLPQIALASPFHYEKLTEKFLTYSYLDLDAKTNNFYNYEQPNYVYAIYVIAFIFCMCIISINIFKWKEF